MTDLQTIVPNELYVISNLLNAEQCSHYIQYIDSRELVCENRQPFDYRFQETCPRPEIANTMWEILQARIPAEFHVRHQTLVPTGCSPLIPIVRYNPDAPQTIRHHDNRRTPDEYYAVIIYLNDNFAGGATAFYDVCQAEIFRTTPNTGDAVMFHLSRYHRGLAPLGKKYIICPRIVCTLKQ